MINAKNGNAFCTRGIAINDICKLFVAVLIFSLSPVVSSFASVTINLSIDAKNIVYDPVTRIANTSSRTTLTINGLNVYADKTQVDFKENILRASGRVVVGTRYTGDEMVVNIKYGDAALYIGKKLETPIYLSINENTGRPVPVIKNIEGLIPEFAQQPEINVIHCQYISYSDPGRFIMNHVYYIDPEGKRRYSSKTITDTPDLLFTKTVSDIVVTTTKSIDSSSYPFSDYKIPKKWYLEDSASVIWLTDSFKNSSWVDLNGTIDPRTGRSYVSPELNYNATVKNTNFNLSTEQSQEMNNTGFSFTKYNDSRKSKGIALSDKRNEYYDRYYYYAYYPYDVRDENQLRAFYEQNQNNQNIYMTFTASDSSSFSRDDRDRSNQFNNIKELSTINNLQRQNRYTLWYSLRPVKPHHFPFLVSFIGSGNFYDIKSENNNINNYYQTNPSGNKVYRYAYNYETNNRTSWDSTLTGELNSGSIAIGRKSFFSMYARYRAIFIGYSNTYHSDYRSEYYSHNAATLDEIEDSSKTHYKRNFYYLTFSSMYHRQLGNNSAIGVAVANSHSYSSSADIYPFISYSSGNGNYYRLEYDYDVKTSRWDPATISARIIGYGNYRYVGSAKYDFRTDRFLSGSHSIDKETGIGVFSLTYEEPTSTFMIRYQSGESYGPNRGGALDDYQQRPEIQ